AVIFDKTGTLTEGRFGVSDIVPRDGVGEDEVLAWAAALESRSEHPIAQGILRSAAERGLPLKTVERFRNLTGRGAEAIVEGQDVKVVSPGYVAEHGLDAGASRSRRLAEQGKTVVHVLRGGKPIGAIALADIIRPESYEAVTRLKAMDLQTMMVTGDAQA